MGLLGHCRDPIGKSGTCPCSTVSSQRTSASISASAKMAKDSKPLKTSLGPLLEANRTLSNCWQTLDLQRLTQLVKSSARRSMQGKPLVHLVGDGEHVGRNFDASRAAGSSEI
jgi:hypothetical protein